MKRTISGNILPIDSVSDKTGRIYPREVVEKAIADYQEKMQKAVAFSEIGSGNSDRIGTEINVDQIVGQVRTLEIRGDHCWAEVEILESTPFSENILPELYKPHLRGIGTLVDGTTVSDLTIIAVDLYPDS